MQVLGTREGTIQKALGELGVWWPNKWAPNGNSSWDDCAMFASWLLFGLNSSNNPIHWVVSGVIERSGQWWWRGNSNIQRGYMVGLLWSNDGSNYHHIGMALESPNWLGQFQTVDANGGGNDRVAIRTRHINNVVGVMAPAYVSSPSDGGSSPVEDEMTPDQLASVLDAIRRDGGNRLRLVGDGGPTKVEKNWITTDRACLIGHSSVFPIDDPLGRDGRIAQLKFADKDSLALPWAENMAMMTTTGFFREVDFVPGSEEFYGEFVKNWIELNPAVPATTWMERRMPNGAIAKFPYMNRQQVWADLGRGVECRWNGVKVDKFIKINATAFGVLVAGKVISISQASVDRANAQIGKHVAEGKAPTTGSQNWVSA